MTEPTAPQLPTDAPQDVKDFFDCKGDKLVWRSGEVTWLGLKVTPTVNFEQDPKNGAITVKVSILGGMISFDLPASVNSAGELVVDTTSVPDLSEWGVGGRPDIDAAIKRINDWFKKNGKKLKPASFKDGAVTLEKIPVGPAPAKTVPVVPQPPVTPPPAKPKPVAPPPPPPPASGSGCSLLGGLLVLLFFGVIVLGAGIGFVFFGGPGPVAQATTTPTAAPSATPTAAPSATASAAPTATGSATSAPTASATAATPTGTPATAIAAACVRVVHEAVRDFVSYLDWYVYLFEEDVDYLEVVVKGANDDEPMHLEFDTQSGAYYGILGLHAAGDKLIVGATLVLLDGTRIDVTDDLAMALGGKTLRVRYPQEDTFGTCPVQ